MGRSKQLAVRSLIAIVCVGAVLGIMLGCNRSESTPTASPTAHEGSEGLQLGPETAESVYAGALCPDNATVRAYSVVAINVEVSLNRYLDYDPDGRMYVLEEELARVRDEEDRNRLARLNGTEPAVSIGLQGDAIQPLALRVNQGECLRLTLRNALEDNEPVTLHLHGSSLHIAATGAPAIATNPDAVVTPGRSVTYEWMVTEDTPEGTHHFHSHGDTREQTNHGLFGAVIVEPRGSAYIDPLTGGELRSGWAAIVRDPVRGDFREFILFYHEIGNENFILLNGNDEPIPQIDPYTSAYRPAARAINYRSEPFMNRLDLQQQLGGFFDKSQAYSSYTFGDPATPIARSYLGDPVKDRVVHGGSEVFHVHHTHGGSIRWNRQTDAEPSTFDTGLNKRPSLLPVVSERVDSQSVGPSESYDLEHECGSGGCQQSVGDYLVHCHVGHHYIAGMWMVWRVYNTLQNGDTSTDTLPPLLELPDREGDARPAVTSQDLVGRTVESQGQPLRISQANLATWVEGQLPPQGQPRGYDASVLDWEVSGTLYLNEPETSQAWSGYRPVQPGDRPPLYFDPLTGKLAYPFLRPHLGRRPPFAPNHGPAPFLDPVTGSGTDPPQPGANGPASLCPTGTALEEYVVHAITVPIPLNERLNIVDPVGQLYVLKEDEDRIRATNDLKTPLAIRANAGEHCVDIIFKSELRDSSENNFFSKANTHIHFVQFDVLASDGVSTGFNYEQSVRPFAVEGETLTAATSAGTDRVRLSDTARFQRGALVGVGMDQNETFEIRRIAAVEGDALVFDAPLEHTHGRGEIVSTEFVRYRWYPDVQFGTAYFHDHVDALSSWKHGLFGALISEPPGSVYRDPYTGQEVRSGPIVDIHTDARVSADVDGSFRELVMFIQDDNPVTRKGRSSGSSFNLRVEPLDLRSGDPADFFNARIHGDPETPVLEAFLGDPVVIRGLVSGTNDVHTWHIDGHWFRIEPHSLSSPPVSTAAIGISERFDMVLPAAGGPQRMTGDYPYYSGRTFKLLEGSWGILRVLDSTRNTSLQPLPGHEGIIQASSSVCPAGAPTQRFNVAVIEIALPMLNGLTGKIYVLQSDKQAVLSGNTPPEPLVLRVNIGDCIVVNLTNETRTGRVSFHADMLAYEPSQQPTAAPGRTVAYTYYASPEIGETASLVRDWGNVLQNPSLGLYGAIIVGPRGATYTHPHTGEDISGAASWAADVHTSGNSYRDFVLLLHDEDEIIGTHQMPYTEHVQGTVAVNYRYEPLDRRLRRNPDTSAVFRSVVHGDPSTPVLQAFAGDAVRIHVLVPVSEQAHVFTIEGHTWPFEPGLDGTNIVSSMLIGGLQTLDIRIASAGGEARLPGQYLYGDHREPYREAGMWGLFKVYARGAEGVDLHRLP